MAAHTYWRMLITASAGVGGYHVAIDELEFLDAAGTRLSTGGTPSASSSFGSPTYDADKAFDASFTTFWHSASFPSVSVPQWIKYQFASPVDVAAVRVTYRTSTPNQAPKDWSIQWSDDNSAWTTAVTYSLNWTSIGLGRCLSFPVTAPATGTYCNWRLKILTNATATAPSGAELEMHETAGGADITNSTVWEYAIWSDQFSAGYEGYKIFDNNTGTIWAASAVPPGNFIGQALNRAVQIEEIKWTARNDSFYGQSPLTGTMQATNDGVTWTDIATVTFGAWISAGQSQTVAVVAAVPFVWHADGTGYAAFQANERDFVWLTDGFGGCTWQSSFAEIAGFRADGTGAAVWYATGTPWQADGHGTAAFNAQTMAAPAAFGSDGHGTCRFAGQQAVGEECLTPETDVPAAIPNFVF